jgi:hypothetical protein
MKPRLLSQCLGESVSCDLGRRRQFASRRRLSQITKRKIVAEGSAVRKASQPSALTSHKCLKKNLASRRLNVNIDVKQANAYCS